jgi:pimeloyl-ACP methyl ester carboxylesterase
MLLYYVDHGPGRVVVLLHGFPLDGSMWEYQRETLGTMYRVIIPDLRGHGGSDTPAGVYSVDTMADDVVQTLNSLRLKEPVVVGGLSMGGYVALSLVARYPERVRALLLMNTRAGADTPQTAQVREELAQQVERLNSAAPVVEAMLPKLVAPFTRTNNATVVARLGEQMAKTTPRGIAGTLRGMAIRPDRTAFLPKINVPTLVIAGADDALIPIDESRAMANAIPGAQLVEVPEAGHLAPLEQPAFTNVHILRFLSGLP